MPESPTLRAPAAAAAAAPVFRDAFASGAGYLAACTQGLPTRATVEATRIDLERWARGEATPGDYDAAIARARSAFARLAGVTVEDVAIGSQASVLASLIAASAPDGAVVVCPEGDFASIVAPFQAQAHRGVQVREVALAGLADAIDGDTWLVAFSLVQSAIGEHADADAILAACARTGTLSLADLTQALGWLPVDASRFDFTITHAYKWLCAPRGSAFLTVRPALRDALTPVHAGWYAGEDPWTSCYGPLLSAASSARRFDVSPAWPVWPGTAAALEFFASLDPAVVRAHATGLADRLAAALDLTDARGDAVRGRAILTWPDADGADLAALTAAGLRASGRAGRARVAFHLWNTHDDVDRVLASLAH
ncbi:aminotransferase class V-fold PLP-dependent enzyme [Leifsonia shinshuensis]|uniref:Aminotransferase class V-fold PLP-dependent enzyme n=1 Tax=Leifsonia shinshuensis TaxID=150026 RepID=A0A7G6Y7V1_9MICO|nr:aminotransferase class V-fold PLP-dependent enzyme [Leifsonia shinshuensis]QNE34566.1 aminotransferase class V-fold PLP-dependent enzyme [Leifsonia shinshuensis]